MPCKADFVSLSQKKKKSKKDIHLIKTKGVRILALARGKGFNLCFCEIYAPRGLARLDSHNFSTIFVGLRAKRILAYNGEGEKRNVFVEVLWLLAGVRSYLVTIRLFHLLVYYYGIFFSAATILFAVQLLNSFGVKFMSRPLFK